MMLKEKNEPKTIMTKNKLSLIVSLMFSLCIVALSLSEVGYIPLTEGERPTLMVDIAVVPAVIASMIGGYVVGIPVAIIWGFTTYLNPDSNLQGFTLPGLLIIKLSVTVSAIYFYGLARKKWKRSPFNVYRAVLASGITKFLVANMVMIVVLHLNGLHDQEEQVSFLYRSVERAVIETGLSMLGMMVVIKHLRQVHILNGVKKRGEKEAKRT